MDHFDADELGQYRSLSSLAVVSVVLGVFSALRRFERERDGRLVAVVDRELRLEQHVLDALARP